jgi:hypothetical protein
MDGERVNPTESQGPWAWMCPVNPTSMARESAAFETFLHVDSRLNINAFIIVNIS